MTAADVCRGCEGAAAATPHGLCAACHGDLRFITRPAAHRELWRREIAEQAPVRLAFQAETGIVVVTGAVPARNDLWLCDFCNTAIPVEADTTLIPLIGSYGLCTPCVSHIPYWPDAWTQPTPRACPCHACQQPIRRLTPTDPTTQHLDQPPLDRQQRRRRDLGRER